MTQANDRDHDRLATQVRDRRLQLGLSRAGLAERAGISKGTCLRVEEGQPIRDTSYAKIDAALEWAPGSCAAIRAGGDPTPATGQTPAVKPVRLIKEEDIGDAVMIMAVKNSDLSAAEIRAMRDGVIEELKQRGLL
ncbi:MULTISPECIES: helix-turn-helix transcriptional regulator [unclassified Streptomyces]|uniref:helix-turn-helix domain-containing protein n=1 Tax=unclassified Streptomyces TaxID=2593676 RepID=UPI003320C231